MGQKGVAGSGRSIGAWSRCSKCRSVCHKGARAAHRRFLVTAGSLINGTTITVYDPRELDELEFFHIKLERHNAIYAEGAPCETMISVEESAINFAEYLRNYGHPITQEKPCAPLLSCNTGRNEIRSRFRSAISPWIDRRQKLDIIRDELEERGIAVLRDRNSSRDYRVLA